MQDSFRLTCVPTLYLLFDVVCVKAWIIWASNPEPTSAAPSIWDTARGLGMNHTPRRRLTHRRHHMALYVIC